MSRVTSNVPLMHNTNGVGQPKKATKSRSSTSLSKNGINDGRDFPIRSAAPPVALKEAVHACPLCNQEYKDPRVLPCTHTFCFNCIREKIIQNDRLTCPKCHYQAHPFDEVNMNDLPPNLILSQGWCIGSRPTPFLPKPKKPMTYQPSVPTSKNISNGSPPPISQEENNRKTRSFEVDENETSTNGITSIVNAFNQQPQATGTGANNNRAYSSQISPCLSQPQPLVSNLIKIYSEATSFKAQRVEINEPTTNKLDELTKIFEQVNTQYQRQISSSSNVKQKYDGQNQQSVEISRVNHTHETTPIPPPFPEKFQFTTENNLRHPSQELLRTSLPPIPREHEETINNHCDSMTPTIRVSPEKSVISEHIPIMSESGAIITLSQKSDNFNDDDTLNNHIPIQQALNNIILQQQNNSKLYHHDSVKSTINNSTSRPFLISPTADHNQQRSNGTSIFDQQDDRMSYCSTSRRSCDRFPPPPQNFETFESINSNISNPRLTNTSAFCTSLNDDYHEPITTIASEAKSMETEYFHPNFDVSPGGHENDSSNMISSLSTPINRPLKISVEHDLSPPYQNDINKNTTPSALLPTNVTSRVDLLLLDQKRLEREIDEQIRRLKYDYDDVKKQIQHKESTIQNEVKNIASRLNNDITEHFHRKQKIYADLAADANTVGTELERLKSNTNGNNTNTNNNNNSNQHLWTNLERIELNIQNIRQAVEQHKESCNALTFAEGRRAIAADTIGQINYNVNEINQNILSSPTQLKSSPSSNPTEQITNLTPYKCLKIDHLSSLEPEAIAITENNKKILLGICNKLFILNEYGDILKTIQLTPSIRGIAISKKHQTHNIAYVSHDEIVSMVDIDSGQTLDCVKETDSSGEAGTFLPIGIDTDNIQGNVYVCDYRNSCVIKFDDKLEFITQWRIYNHSDQYDEARPKLLSVHGQRLYMIVEHSCKPYYNQGIAYTFSLHICDANSGYIIKIIDAELLSTQRLRWPCSIQAINHERCYILDTMTSGKYFNGQWQKHWSRVLEIGLDNSNVVTELFQLDSEAGTMAMSKQSMIIAANGEIFFVDLAFFQQQKSLYS